jgi:ferredoxin-thioredoxin reductase catalytic subunit
MRSQLNPDVNHCINIMEGIKQKGGFCPCKTGKSLEDRCPCTEFMDTEYCHCKLFIPIEEF